MAGSGVRIFPGCWLDHDQTPALSHGAGVFSYAGEFMANESERVGFLISTPAESGRLRRASKVDFLLHQH